MFQRPRKTKVCIFSCKGKNGVFIASSRAWPEGPPASPASPSTSSSGGCPSRASPAARARASFPIPLPTLTPGKVAAARRAQFEMEAREIIHTRLHASDGAILFRGRAAGEGKSGAAAGAAGGKEGETPWFINSFREFNDVVANLGFTKMDSYAGGAAIRDKPDEDFEKGRQRMEYSERYGHWHAYAGYQKTPLP